MKSLQTKVTVFLKGFAMGSADVVPGVSGGTIAFITGIYDQLVDGIANMGLRHLLALLKLLIYFWHSEKRKESIQVLQEIDFGFFIPLGLGIGIAILTMAKWIPHFMKHYPQETYALFFGLIAASARIPFDETSKTAKDYTVLILVALLSFLFFLFVGSGEGSDSWAYLFISGFIAICALVLPGISGSYILVLMGQYEVVLTAVHERNIIILGVFALGMVTGLFSFIRILQWLLKKAHSETMSALTGVMIGSLVVIWPLNYVAEGDDPHWPQIVGFTFLGAVIVSVLARFGRRVVT